LINYISYLNVVFVFLLLFLLKPGTDKE